MALADPQTITVNSIAKTLNRISTDGLKSVYQTDDGIYKMTISHQDTGKRVRRMVRIDHKVIAADPISALNESKTLGFYLVIDEPNFGFDDAAISLDVAALVAWLTPTNVGKVCATQH